MDRSQMSVRLLGQFRITHGETLVEVGGPVAQAIVAVLAYPPDTKVLPDQLITAVWGSPGTVTTDNLYHYVSRLRRALAPTGLRIVGHRPGYRLPVTVEQVDAARFDELLQSARALRETDPDQAVHRLHAALDLWSGPTALDNLVQPGIRRLAAGLDARRLDAEEDLAILELDRGNAEVVLDRLHTLVAAHPRRAGLTGALVRALHAMGRDEEAARLLDRAEQAAARHGNRIQPALTRARQVLASGSGRRSTTAGSWQSPTVPFQLPADTTHFTGRDGEVARLATLWPEHGGAAPLAVMVSAVEGMAGVGKTALAVHAAHRLADRFADGVLFIDLHGFTPGADPTPPDTALDTLLRGLGVPGQSIPPDIDGRVALYRSTLARRRVLIVLDNAADEAQTRPLVPATPGCLVLVTSRRRLAALDDAVHLHVDTLAPAEAVALFRRAVGDRAAVADEHTLARIVELCGHLPLAIRIAAARLRTSRALTPTHLHAELTSELRERRSLGRLTDGERTVDAALALSYRDLTTEQQRAFRLIGLHPGTHLGPHALAALADTTVAQAQQVLDQLERANLIDQPAYQRYAPHDLVRLYAANLVQEDPATDRRAALGRLVDHYGHTTSSALSLIYPHASGRRAHPPATHIPRATLDSPKHAQEWLDGELDNVLAAARNAPNHGRPDHTIHQSTALHHHLRLCGHSADAARLHEQALRLARDAGDRTGELDAVTGLGNVHLVHGRYERATACFEQALDIARATGDHVGEQQALTGLARAHFFQGGCERATACFEQALDIARATGTEQTEHDALMGLGKVHWIQGGYGLATDCFAEALKLARDTGNRPLEREALTALGGVDWVRGRYGSATDCFDNALALARDAGDRISETIALNGLGHVHRLQGRYGPAADCFEQALDIARDTLIRHSEQDALGGLGGVHYMRRQFGPAADCYEQLLALGIENGNRNFQFEGHQGLGRVHNALGNHDAALEHHRTALELASALDQAPDQARAHDGLACTHHALGQTGDAGHHWHAALTILTALGTDHTEEPEVTIATIRSRLAHLHGPPT